MLASVFLFGIEIYFICALSVSEIELGSNPPYESIEPAPVADIPIPISVFPTPVSQFSQLPGFSNAVNYPMVISAAVSQDVIVNSASAGSSQQVIASCASTSNFPPVITDTKSASKLQPVVANTASSSSSQLSIASTASSSGNTMSTSSAVVVPPIVESFSNSLLKATLSVPALQKFLQIEMPSYETSNTFYTLDYQVLVDYENPEPATLAQVISQAVGSHDEWNLPFYFRVVGNTIGKFLYSKGVLLPETSLSISQSYASFIEAALESSNVNSNELLFQALLDGFVHFLNSLGFNFGVISTEIAYLFSNEIKAL